MNRQEQLRTFHLTGNGLDDLKPGGPLRPESWNEPEGTPAVPVAAGALVPMYAAAAVAARGQARRDLWQRARQLHHKMLELLAMDAAHGGESPEQLAMSIGVEAKFFNTGAMARAMEHVAQGAKTYPADRRRRIANAAEVLARFVKAFESHTVVWLFQSGPVEESAEGTCVVPSAAPGKDAAEFLRKALGEFAEVLRAMRVARLEAESAYEADPHDERIARMSWRSAEPRELAALPLVAVLCKPGDGLSALQPALPLHVLIGCPAMEGADLGFLAMAHREVFVVQESVSRPDRLMEGLTAMAAVTGPAVAVVSVPGGRPGGTKALTALWRSRAFPLFRYEPARGETLASRFALDRSGLDGLSPAEAAAMLPLLAPHFRVVAESETGGDLGEFAEYLKLDAVNAARAIPYVRVAVNGGVQRAVMTRELALACRDRLRAYRMLEEIAGIGNSFAEAAVERVKAEMEEQAKARELAALQQGRREGAVNAVNRLVSALTSPKPLDAASLTAQAPVAMAAPAATTPVKAAEAPKETAPAPASGDAPADPYIDTFLCTSCNDCMKVNPRLFLYNADKQAYLGDPSVGTFADLVKAGEGCPAKCIHPGQPRPGDATATPAMLARAAKLG